MSLKEDISMKVNGRSKVPPGFRFHPTEEELLHYYLRKKIAYEKIDLDVIREVDLNKLEPWDIQGSTPQNDWYFFSHKDKKYPTGTRTNRATAAGFWKATGRDKVVYSSLKRIGMRKTLVSNFCDCGHEEGWVVCRVFKKKNYHKSLESTQRSLSATTDTTGAQSESLNNDGSIILDQLLAYMDSSRSCKQESSETFTHNSNSMQQFVNPMSNVDNMFLHLPRLDSPCPESDQAEYPRNTMVDEHEQCISNWVDLDKFVASQLNGQMESSKHHLFSCYGEHNDEQDLCGYRMTDRLNEEASYNTEKREKRRWLFRRSSNNTVVQHQSQVKDNDNKASTNDVPQQPKHIIDLATTDEEKHAILMAAATIKAAEAAATTAHAAAEIIRLTTRPSSISVKHHFAAILIQTSFRGYLARSALRALKGIVMLQAVIRGQNVRKQATITLKCMQALLRVQSRLQDQRSRLSHDGGRKSMIAETANFWESKYLQDIRQRKSMSRDGSCFPDDWSDRPHTLEELDAILQSRKDRETSLATAFSQQKPNRNPSNMDEELEESASWLDRWIEAKQWENQRSSRASFDRRDSIKTVEIDNSRPNSRSGTSMHKLPHHTSHYIPNSPSRRSSYSPSNGQQPITPSPIKTRPLQIRSASPRCLKEERSYVNTNIQSLRSTPRVMGSMCRYSTCANDTAIPNYMAATESAKAKTRSQSTPRQRPSTPERERVGSAKKRLAYPIPDPCDDYKAHYYDYGHNLRSPSFKSVQVGHVGMGQQWYYAESTAGEISPCSTTDLRRWLR
ncbi:protein of unknown function DUF4005 [Cynara cardunculus var. scolymus]|uniref:NAC domain-containing protein n=1 Tax=Cynara cardunculus var. scolymus TaxID=59895 RepID=A0A124SCY1_CYNCS|nr:protein of unknown function DUF4005 [Cynara cardunculus var. scolymus]